MQKTLLALAGIWAFVPPPGPPVLIAAGALQPHLAASADGEFFATFLREGNIEWSQSADQGKTWSPPRVAIDARGKARGGLQRGPRIAVDGRKTLYITAPLCFDEAELRKPYPSQDLYLAVSTDGGDCWTAPAQINDLPRAAEESLHWLAASPAGDVHVGWIDFRLKKKSLGYAKISDQGRTIGRNVIIAEGPLCECCAPGLAVDARGNPFFVYREGGKNANRAIWLVASTDGGRTFNSPVRINRGESKVDS